MATTVDHIIYGAPDLEAGIDEVERLLGVRAARGGRHVGLGTHNALIPFGRRCYLEILAPDPEQPEMAGRRVFDVDRLERSRLVTWVARASDLETIAARAAGAGIDVGKITSGGRARPDGTRVSWRVTDPYRMGLGGVQPFFIDWGDSAHPGDGEATGCALASLRAEHPDPRAATAVLDALGASLPVTRGAAPALVATLDAPAGRVEIR